MNPQLTADLGEFSFDHVGVAVKSIADGRRFYDDLGLNSQSAVEEVPHEKVRVLMLELANNCRIELIEPTAPDSTIAKFLSQRGPGIHHICLRVVDIDRLLIKLKDHGHKLIHDQAFMGAHHCRVAFVHPKATGGVLLELSEPQSNNKATSHT